jgi:dUTP pyrophosphatase
VVLINLGEEPFEIAVGDRVAQFIIEKIEHPVLEEVADAADLENSSRGEGGFGSTGINSTSEQAAESS